MATGLRRERFLLFRCAEGVSKVGRLLAMCEFGHGATRTGTAACCNSSASYVVAQAGELQANRSSLLVVGMRF